MPALTTVEQVINWKKQCLWDAQVFVNGMRVNDQTGEMRLASGEWASRFVGNETVEMANREGWAKELRSACKHRAFEFFWKEKPIYDVNLLMPGHEWIAAARANAKRYREAEKQREEKLGPIGANPGLLRKFGITKEAAE